MEGFPWYKKYVQFNCFTYKVDPDARRCASAGVRKDCVGAQIFCTVMFVQ